MARTVGDVFKRVGEVLNDATNTRYPTAQLGAYLNDAVIEARSIRPDLFVGQYGAALTQIDPSNTNAAFPLPDQFFPAVCFYVAGRAELRDDEFAVDGRAMTLLSTFGKKLVAGA